MKGTNCNLAYAQTDSLLSFLLFFQLSENKNKNKKFFLLNIAIFYYFLLLGLKRSIQKLVRILGYSLPIDIFGY